MRLLSFNVGEPMPHLIDGRPLATGIYKWPRLGAIHVGRLGAHGDGQANQPNHGGPDQALSFYSAVHYQFWGAELGRDDFAAGVFGENLTVESMTEGEICIGDVFTIGTTTLQVTHPRIPCFRLSHRLGVPLFHEQQLKSGRIGYLARVLKEGEIEAGSDIELIERDAEPISVAQCIAATLSDEEWPHLLERLKALPHLSAKLRALISTRLGALGAFARS
jgi:MOSC domain-containing protein YiiM